MATGAEIGAGTVAWTTRAVDANASGTVYKVSLGDPPAHGAQPVGLPNSGAAKAAHNHGYANDQFKTARWAHACRRPTESELSRGAGS